MNRLKHLFLRGYVPEATFLCKKKRPTVQTCREDCAVIDVTNGFLILASRGTSLPEGTDLRRALNMTETEQAQFSELCRKHTHLFLTVGGLPVLLFSDFLSSTGLLLAVIPHAPSNTVLPALQHLNRTDFFTPPSEEAKRCTVSEIRRASDLLADLLYYTDRILQSKPTQLNQQYYLAHTAAFAGCALDLETVRNFAKMDDPLKSPRTVLFLLCVFLFLRNQAGSLLAKRKKASVVYHVTLRSITERSKDPCVPLPTFAKAPCFSAYKLEPRADGNTAIVFRDPAQMHALSCAFCGVPRQILLYIEARTA